MLVRNSFRGGQNLSFLPSVIPFFSSFLPSSFLFPSIIFSVCLSFFPFLFLLSCFLNYFFFSIREEVSVEWWYSDNSLPKKHLGRKSQTLQGNDLQKSRAKCTNVSTNLQVSDIFMSSSFSQCPSSLYNPLFWAMCKIQPFFK